MTALQKSEGLLYLLEKFFSFVSIFDIFAETTLRTTRYFIKSTELLLVSTSVVFFQLNLVLNSCEVFL